MRWFFGLALLAAGAFASWHFFHSPRYSYRLAVCAILKNEGPWLKEWIAYHHDVLGVDHFYLYDNDGTDKSLSILRPYIDRGIVEWIDWNSQDETHHTSGAFMDAPWSACQLGAYNDCLKKRAFGKAQWVAMIDADEFIVPVHGIKSFYDLLKKAEKTNRGSVRIFWRVFGTSGVLALAEGELLTEKLIHRSEDAFAWNQLVKSIHRPEAVAFCLVHEAERPTHPIGARPGSPMPCGSITTGRARSKTAFPKEV